MSLSPALRWRSVPIEALVLREWDGEIVVRNERSGSTHLLGPLASQVLKVLAAADRPLTSAEVEDRLAATGSSPGTAVEVAAVLSEFGRLGLAEPAAAA
ncbi:MAG TPA: hypothetical protein VMQ50_02600 [Casimicrobiaceae bacterium]|nr:hypothetical protein [Casimicrobiaceae bacterium]